MPNPCCGIKNDGAFCRVNGKTLVVGETGWMCGTHAKAHAKHVERVGAPTGCIRWRGNRWCGEPVHAAGEHVCADCNLNAVTIVNVAAVDRTVQMMDMLTVGWRDVVRLYIDVAGVREYRMRRAWVAMWNWGVARQVQPRWALLRAHWLWIEGGRNGPDPTLAAPVQRAAAPAPQRELAAFVRDRQNVHTAVVTNKTNEGLDVLLNTPVPAGQNTEMHLLAMWCTSLPSEYRPTMNQCLPILTDIHYWYTLRTCRTQNDRLFARVLDGLVAKIESVSSAETRKELYLRLLEESADSVGMCCDGHISRLINVFSGFDEAFAPPRSLGDVMQERMAEISRMDIDEDSKKKLATAFFDEHGVDASERSAWLEAF